MEKNKLLHRVLLIYLLLLALSILGGCQSEEEKESLQLEAFEKEAREANRLLSIEPFKSYLEASPIIVGTEVGDKTMDSQSFYYDLGTTLGHINIHHRSEGSFTHGLFADTLSRMSIFIDKDVYFEPEYQKLIKDLLVMVDRKFDYEDFNMKIKERDPLKDSMYPFGVGSIEYRSYHYRTKKRVESPFISITVEPYSDKIIEGIKKK